LSRPQLLAEPAAKPPGFAVEPDNLTVLPGGRVTITGLLTNRSAEPAAYQVSVSGVPSSWITVPTPICRLYPGEQNEVRITVQVPLRPEGRVGRYPLKLRAFSTFDPSRWTEVDAALIVAAFELQGRIGILLENTRFSARPGETVTLSVGLLNQGLVNDRFRLSVHGIPETRVSSATPVVWMAPGEQKGAVITLQMPRDFTLPAGEHAFTIRIASLESPAAVAEMECALSLSEVRQLSGILLPQRAQAGSAATVAVQNRGNVEERFAVTWQSRAGLVFSARENGPITVPPGGSARTEFNARPRHRPLFGGEAVYEYEAVVRSEGGEEVYKGEIVSRSLVPMWVGWIGVALLILAVISGILYVWAMRPV